jgi:hypothetical protein
MITIRLTIHNHPLDKWMILYSLAMAFGPNHQGNQQGNSHGMGATGGASGGCLLVCPP